MKLFTAILIFVFWPALSVPSVETRITTGRALLAEEEEAGPSCDGCEVEKPQRDTSRLVHGATPPHMMPRGGYRKLIDFKPGYCDLNNAQTGCDEGPAKAQADEKIRNPSTTRTTTFTLWVPGENVTSQAVPPGGSYHLKIGDPATNMWKDVPCGTKIELEVSIPLGNNNVSAVIYVYEVGSCDFKPREPEPEPLQLPPDASETPGG